jgi:hypothetical protein
MSEIAISVKYEELVSTFYQKVKKDAEILYFKGEQYGKDNLIVVTAFLMKEAGKVKNLVGFERKMLVVKTTHKLLDDQLVSLKNKVEEWSEEHQTHWDSLQTYIDENVDPLIDQLYTLAPQVYGQAKKKFWACCS